MLGDMEAASRHLVNAAEAFERVLQSDPRDLNTQYQLAVCLRLLGDLKAAGGDLAAAQSRYDQAESHFELLAYHNPDVPEYQAGLAGVAMNRGNFQFKLGGPEMAEAARQSLRQAIGILEKLVEQYPEAASYPADLQAARGALEQFSQ
jgi:tetratricopeptide (TPR) repeat protein